MECGSQFSVALTKSGAVYTWYARFYLFKSTKSRLLIRSHFNCLFVDRNVVSVAGCGLCLAVSVWCLLQEGGAGW